MLVISSWNTRLLRARGLSTVIASTGTIWTSEAVVIQQTSGASDRRFEKNGEACRSGRCRERLHCARQGGAEMRACPSLAKGNNPLPADYSAPTARPQCYRGGGLYRVA